MRNARVLLTAAAAAAALAIPAESAAQAPAQGQPPGRPDTVALVFYREVFTYAGDGRRDPFGPLTGNQQVGPRFEQLGLQGIIYSTGRNGSIALLTDGSQVYRVRVGDVVGNSRVVEIGPLRVVLAVETFGTIRQEMLELPTRGGADR